MTNAEKFKEDFGFWIDEDACITNVNGCGKCPLDKYRDTDKRQDCTQGFWSSEYQGTPTIPLSVIEKIKAEINTRRNRNITLFKADGLTKQELTFSDSAYVEVLGIIDEAVREVTHET